tara:strand:- start:389 stop:544 length:156 start_codon:yes stop_codon:yes gene_type:complete
MGIAMGIGIGTTNITGSSSAGTPFFEILAESGDFLMSESGASSTFLITEQQ